MTETDHRPLAGRTALVTGSARNIGRAIALRLAGDGANVVVNAVQDGDAAAAVAAEAESLGVGAIAHVADITDADAVAAMVGAGREAFGAIHILVINASVRGQQPFLDMDHDEFRRVVDVSLDGAFLTAKACVHDMVEAGWGRIVTLGGLSWHVGTRNRVHNLVAKSGLTGFTRGLAVELAEHGITVNSVAPGFIDTERPASAGVRPPLKVEPPVARLGRTDEIAAAVGYLCGPGSDYTTGQILHVNGGMFLGT